MADRVAAGRALGLVRLPGLYCIFLAAMRLGYVTIMQLVKSWSVRRFGE